MEAKKTKLLAIKPELTKDELYEIYLSGRAMFVETEITHDKSVIIDYLEGIRDLVSPDFEDCYDNIWSSIIDDDILGKGLWKLRLNSQTSFNKYFLYKIIGVLHNNSVYTPAVPLSKLGKGIEDAHTAEVLRPYLSRGLDRDSMLRIHDILKKFEVGKNNKLPNLEVSVTLQQNF